MPSEDEILETQLWTFAAYAQRLSHCIEYRYMTPDGVEYQLKEVVDLSAELHKKVIIVLEQVPYGAQDTAVEAQSSEGDVQSSRPDGLDREVAASARPAAASSGGAEGRGGRAVRKSDNGENGSSQTDGDTTGHQGSARLILSEIRDLVDRIGYLVATEASPSEIQDEIGKCGGRVEVLDEVLTNIEYELKDMLKVR